VTPRTATVGFIFGVQRDASVADAARTMTTNNVGIVAVFAGDRPVGVFSERDIVRRVVDRGFDPRRGGTAARRCRAIEPVRAGRWLRDGLGQWRRAAARSNIFCSARAGRQRHVSGAYPLIQLGK
jgi:CBS domain